MNESNATNIFRGWAIITANFNEFLEAYNLGKTSPKSKIKKVTKITSNKNFNKPDAISANKKSPI